MSGHEPTSSAESVQRIEPARFDYPPEQIADLAAELSAAWAKLGRQLHSRTAGNLADLVRIMNIRERRRVHRRQRQPHRSC